MDSQDAQAEGNKLLREGNISPAGEFPECDMPVSFKAVYLSLCAQLVSSDCSFNSLLIGRRKRSRYRFYKAHPEVRPKMLGLSEWLPKIEPIPER